MTKLEQHCWQYLLGIVNSSNCLVLHELADRYDCPPLKLSAWRTIHESAPGYNNLPSRLIETISSSLVSPDNGLTGPIDTLNTNNYGNQSVNDYSVNDYDELFSDNDEDNVPMIFGNYSNQHDFVHPSDLPKNSSAADVIRSWAIHLSNVYNQCLPEINHIEEMGENFQQNEESGIDWYSEIREVYLIMNMRDKLDSIPNILEMWSGREDELVRSLIYKYKDTMPDDTKRHLLDLLLLN